MYVTHVTTVFDPTPICPQCGSKSFPDIKAPILVADNIGRLIRVDYRESCNKCGYWRKRRND